MQNLQYAYLKTSACKLNENALQLYKRRNSFQGFFGKLGDLACVVYQSV